LILLITHACQLRCTYCRVAKFSDNMSTATMRRGIDLLLTSDRPEIQLQFFGGDPLLKHDLIVKAVEYLEERRAAPARRVRYMLTTNGHALDARKLGFFKKHDFLIEFSFDGDCETFRSQRPGIGDRDFYEMIKARLGDLKESGVPYYVIQVVTPESAGKLFDNVRYIASLGHKRIQVNYQLGRYWEPEAVKGLILQMGRVAELSRRTGSFEFINVTQIRREPTVLNSELVVDVDGGIYRETGICLEDDFQRQKKDFFVTDVANASALPRYPASPFDNFLLLSEIYGRRSPQFRRIILNNIEVGYAIDRWTRKIAAAGRTGGKNGAAS
jgi:uncharacterized protein